MSMQSDYSSELEKKVMGNVAAIYVGRKLISATALKFYVLGLSLIAVTSLVSVPHVLANLMQVGLPGLATFALAAVLKTKLLVQLGLIVALGVCGSLFAEFFKRENTMQRAAL